MDHMANLEQYQALGDHFPTGWVLPLPLPIPRQPLNRDRRDDAHHQNLGVPPAEPNGQPDVYIDGRYPDIVGPGMPHGPLYAEVVYDGMVDYRALPLHAPVLYGPPDIGVAQGIPAPERHNAPEAVNQDPDILDYAPQHIPRFLAEAALPEPGAHQIPVPGQPAVENLRRSAIRLLYRPDSQVDRISIEPGAAGLCTVVIVLELADIL